MDNSEIRIKVENCIERFGINFHRVSDQNYWYEYDAQFRLMGTLSQEIDHGLSPGFLPGYSY